MTTATNPALKRINVTSLNVYLPGTLLPEIGAMRVLTFELRFNNKRQRNQWTAFDNTLEGTTQFIIDDTATMQPSVDKTKWQVRITKIIKDQPSNDDQTMFYRMIAVELVSSVDGTKMIPLPKPDGKVSKPGNSEPVKPETRRKFCNVMFSESSPGTWSYCFLRADNVTEMFVLQLVNNNHRPPVVKRHTGGTTTMPLDVEVVKELDGNPKLLKFLVRRVTNN